jgi:hypothetical protein
MQKSKIKYFKSPVFIMGTPRSGTTLTYLLLSSSCGAWSTFDEDNPIFEGELGLRIDPKNDPDEKGVSLDQGAATPERIEKIYAYFWDWVANPAIFGVSGFEWGWKRKMANRASRILRKTLRLPFTMVHKNTRNTFRIGFIRAVFPNARFVFVFRDGRANVSSLIEGWGFERFHTFQVPVPDRVGKKGLRQWAFELPPHWKAWADKSIPEICAFQWCEHNASLLNHRAQLAQKSYIDVRYEDLVADTPGEVNRLCRFLNLPVGKALRGACVKPRPVVETSLPQKNKWLKRKDQIESVRHIMEPMMERLDYSWE